MSAVRAALAEMVGLMMTGDEPGVGSPWYQRAVAALAAPVAAPVAMPSPIEGQSAFSRAVLHAVYYACQRGDSPERLHAAVMAEFDKQPSGRDAALVAIYAKALKEIRYCCAVPQAQAMRHIAVTALAAHPANVAQVAELSDAGIPASVLENEISNAIYGCGEMLEDHNGAVYEIAKAVQAILAAAKKGDAS